ERVTIIFHELTASSELIFNRRIIRRDEITIGSFNRVKAIAFSNFHVREHLFGNDSSRGCSNRSEFNRRNHTNLHTYIYYNKATLLEGQIIIMDIIMPTGGQLGHTTVHMGNIVHP